MRNKLLVAALGLLCGGLGSSLRAEPAPLSVAAAISLQETITAIAADFEKERGVKVELAFGSSGQLLAQIRSGAPFDVFVSAANEQVDALVAERLVVEDSVRKVAGNELVLIAPTAAKSPPGRFEELAAEGVKRIAIGDPATVPAGKYASEVLTHLKLDAAVKDRLVFGKNVRQVLDYVERGEVDAGVVYATDAKEAGDKVRVLATADAGWHAPIEYPAAVLKRTQQVDEASAFVAFLGSEKGRAQLRRHGFTIPQRAGERAPVATSPPAPSGGRP
jgi:molybdate transport system substrate-binding protein